MEYANQLVCVVSATDPVSDTILAFKIPPALICTRCDNLIPGMALWKQNLLTCALVAAVAFEILSL
jgi:hypothetical protein